MNFEDRNIFEQLNGITNINNTSSCSMINLYSILTCGWFENTIEIHEYLISLKEHTRKTYREIAIESNFKESYLKEIITINKKRRKKRMPSRDCLIGLCFAFELNLKESNYLLKAGGFNDLYHRNIRDVIIAKFINKQRKLEECNKYLIENSYKQIGNLDLEEVY